MKRQYRKDLQLDEQTFNYITTMENSSKYLRELILRDMNTKEYYLKQKEDLENEKREHEIKVKEINLELKHVQDELERLEYLNNQRPDNYDDAVDVLLTRERVTRADIEYQAKRIDVSSQMFRRMLFDDGVYDKLIEL